MTKRNPKYKTTISTTNGTIYGNFFSDDGVTTVITKKNGRGRARIKKMRKKRIGAK